MGKKKKVKDPDYLTAVKRADREREIALHGKLISTRPLRIEKSKKVYDRNRYRKGGCSHYDDSLLFFGGITNERTFYCNPKILAFKISLSAFRSLT